MKFIATKKLLRTIALLRTEGIRQSALAARAGIPPSRASSIVHGLYVVRNDDPRILRFCDLVGLPFDQAFAPAPDVNDGQPVA